ncbi:MAG: YqhA family protein [Chloroflexaceae bacterium]|nr:YqhA family protein [Chloroflexaceae bacterium]
MQKMFFRVRYMTILAVLGGLVGSFLMFLIGSWHIIEAFILFLGLHAPKIAGNEAGEAIIKVIEALDNFLLALVLLYMAYSIYFLFLQDKQSHETRTALGMPAWMHVTNLGEMKKVLLEVLLVLLTVFFVKIVFTEEQELSCQF